MAWHTGLGKAFTAWPFNCPCVWENRVPPMNLNLQALARGHSHRLEISAANMQRGDPEFQPSKAGAMRRRKALRSSGYRVTIFQITPTGGLIQVSNG